ncbi:TcaA 3rd/4th domain-containing protein [Clostridium nigeriense]|uniref:TcaA 3rd/4th domain-containing protein n=1 Tax=Clostridium nigeriense TaxID=1805470 RepID=UPI003D3357EE
MEKLKKLVRGFKKNFKLLIKDISNLTFENLKDFIKRRKLLILVTLVLIFAIIVFGVGKYKSSKNIVLKNLEIALKENKPEKIYKEIKLDGNKISKNEFEPLAEYYSENTSKVDNIIKNLKSNGESGYFSLINDKILFFDNYHIEIKPVAVEINTNFDETKVYINGIKFEETNLKRNLIPGKYLIKGELDTLYGVIEEEKEVYIMEDFAYNLNMPAININLTSNFEDAKVFINDEDINKSVKDIQKYGPIPLNKEINIQLEREFPWGTLKSDKVTIGTLPNINIDINMVNDNLIDGVNKSCNSFYTSVFNALNDSDYSLIENSRDDAKSKIYDSIKRESLFLKNNYELNDLNTEIKSSEFYYEDGIYKGNIVIKLNYNISKKILPFIDNNVEEMFLTQIEFENNQWIIVDVQKFTLE